MDKERRPHFCCLYEWENCETREQLSRFVYVPKNMIRIRVCFKYITRRQTFLNSFLLKNVEKEINMSFTQFLHVHEKISINFKIFE